MMPGRALTGRVHLVAATPKRARMRHAGRDGRWDVPGRERAIRDGGPRAAARAGTTHGDGAARERARRSACCRWRAAWRDATRTRASRSTTSSRSRRVGLLKAIDRFDLDRDVRFATFAVPTIAGELKRHFRDRGWMLRVPREVQELSARASRIAREALTRDLGRSPTVEELAGGSTRERRAGARGARRRRRLPHDVARRAAGRTAPARSRRSAATTQGFERAEQRAHAAPRPRRAWPRASARSCACASSRA